MLLKSALPMITYCKIVARLVATKYNPSPAFNVSVNHPIMIGIMTVIVIAQIGLTLKYSRRRAEIG